MADAFFLILLVSTLRAVIDKRRIAAWTISLSVIAIVSRLFRLCVTSAKLSAGVATVVDATIASSHLALFILITAILIKHVLKTEKVGSQKIYCAICGYMFIGFTWSFMYHLVFMVNPDTFSIPETIDVADTSVFLYFSFVTLSTLGYGDITGVSQFTRSLTDWRRSLARCTLRS